MNDERLKTPRKYSAGRLAAAAAFCPACRYRLPSREVTKCPACGFTGADTMRLFPFGAPPLERVSDHANLFGGGERQWLEEEVGRLARHFPQITWRVVTVKLEDPAQLGLFGFWLLNVSPPAVDEKEGDRAWTLLLLIEEQGGVAIVPGYGVEPWLPAEAWEKLLAELSQGLQEHRLRAMEGFFRGSSERLHQGWLQVRDRLAAASNERTGSRG